MIVQRAYVVDGKRKYDLKFQDRDGSRVPYAVADEELLPLLRPGWVGDRAWHEISDALELA